jgi:macrodomain Ter protein organizer (MatP/YcbG family)
LLRRHICGENRHLRKARNRRGKVNWQLHQTFQINDKVFQISLQIINRTRIFVFKTRIMTTKLTLTLEKSIIERAKSYAKKTGRSLSELIESYLENITEENYNSDLSPKLKKLIGSVKLPEDFDEEKELRSAVEKKHLI